FGARQASFIVFLVVLLACALAATTRPSIASAPVATRTPPRSAPAASPSPHGERSGTALSPAAPVSSVSADRRTPRPRRPRAAPTPSRNHTCDHILNTSRSESYYEQQIVRPAAEDKRATGQRPRLFRPSFEAHDRSLDRWLQGRGMLEVLWRPDSEASQGATTSRVVRTVRRGIRPGAIILLHDNRGTTENALTEILH